MKYIALAGLGLLALGGCQPRQAAITADPDGTLRQNGQPVVVEMKDGSKAPVSVAPSTTPVPSQDSAAQQSVADEEARAKKQQEREDRLNVLNARIDAAYAKKSGDYDKDKDINEEIRILEYERDLLKTEH